MIGSITQSLWITDTCITGAEWSSQSNLKATAIWSMLYLVALKVVLGRFERQLATAAGLTLQDDGNVGIRGSPPLVCSSPQTIAYQGSLGQPPADYLVENQ